ncbi:MAG: ABC transporter ATP-binding protein [Desulfosalsimonadaceae bacterium]
MGTDHFVIELENICLTYREDRTVLSGLSFQLPKGAKTGLIGPNGSGKTTLLHMIMGLIPQSGGAIRLFDREMQGETDFRKVRKNIGLIFQNADDQLFSPTVIEDVAFGPLNLGATPAEARKIAVKTLNELNLAGFEDRIAYRLSGGEKKLVALATVLAMDPEVLLMDEPTTGLDEATRERIITVLNKLDKTLLIASHEYDFLARTTKDIYKMEAGRMVSAGDAALLHPHYHAHAAGDVPHRHN